MGSHRYPLPAIYVTFIFPENSKNKIFSHGTPTGTISHKKSVIRYHIGTIKDIIILQLGTIYYYIFPWDSLTASPKNLIASSLRM